jgi:hypothetical protein
MNEERIPKNVLNIKSKRKMPKRETNQDGNNKLGKISHRRKEGRPWDKTEEGSVRRQR